MLEIIQTVDETILLWIQETVRQGWLNPLVEFYTCLLYTSDAADE